jgi:hypothetical protein
MASSLHNFKSKRWSFIIVAWVLFICSVHLYFVGLFMTKKELTNKASYYWRDDPLWLNSPLKIQAEERKGSVKDTPRRPKLIMMLVDALREDFVSFSDGPRRGTGPPAHFLAREQSAYQGYQMELLNSLVERESENALLLPMEAELPTVTTVRIKAIMTGALSSFFETKEDFAKDIIPEDNVLHQTKAAEDPKDKKRVIFTGDHIWLDMFGTYFDKEMHYPSFNIRDLDTNDASVREDLQDILKR